MMATKDQKIAAAFGLCLGFALGCTAIKLFGSSEANENTPLLTPTSHNHREVFGQKVSESYSDPRYTKLESDYKKLHAQYLELKNQHRSNKNQPKEKLNHQDVVDYLGSLPNDQRISLITSTAGPQSGKTFINGRRVAPFSDVRFKKDSVHIEVSGMWYELQALDHLDIDVIRQYCLTQYGDKWMERFVEDIDVVAAQMGHDLREQVTLRVKHLDNAMVTHLYDVPLTKEKRQKAKKSEYRVED